MGFKTSISSKDGKPSKKKTFLLNLLYFTFSKCNCLHSFDFDFDFLVVGFLL
jgi:hypothetical protein